jgi:arginyl-tRNA synthetase
MIRENSMEKIYSILSSLASEMGVSDIDFKVETPKEKSHGDLSTNLALVMAKKLNKNPMDIAADIAAKLLTDDSFISDVQVASPGFINFYFSHKYFRTYPNHTCKSLMARLRGCYYFGSYVLWNNNAILYSCFILHSF